MFRFAVEAFALRTGVLSVVHFVLFQFPKKSVKYDGNLGHGWRECGNCKTSPADPFNFCVGEGYGEIVEALGGDRYRAFRIGTTIVLD